MPISVVFDPPLPSDSPSTFNTKAFTLLGDLNDWSTQANALPGEVATNLTTLLASPPAIGSTTPAAGSFTTLSASGGVTNTAGRSNFSSNDAYAIGAKNTGGGPVYFGATDSTASPGGHIANAGGVDIISWTNAGAVTIPGGITQESVIAPTLLNSWVNFGAGYSSAGYWKDTLGVVHLQGLMKSGTVGAAAFTLPVGYRPAAECYFACHSNSLFAFAFVNSSGSVVLASGSNASFSIDGISFRAA